MTAEERSDQPRGAAGPGSPETDSQEGGPGSAPTIPPSGHPDLVSPDGLPPAAGPLDAPPGSTGDDLAPDRASREPRPFVERVGMAAIAAVLALLFAGVAALSFASGEPFLALMAGVGALMTAWVGGMTLLRG